MSSRNKYRVGDFVYFEVSSTAPYQIGRLEGLVMTASGVEAKVICYFRRRDIPNTLIQQAEKYYFQETSNLNGHSSSAFSDLQRHQIKHRELFYSRASETLPAEHIRGKCFVVLYNDIQPMATYLENEDTFFYRLIYEPRTKRLQEDRGSMRIGLDFQSSIPALLENGVKDPRFDQHLEELVWDPVRALPSPEMDTFTATVRAVGLYGRACDSTSSPPQPLLINAATVASRDISLQFAHDILFQSGYDIRKALALLLPDGQPVVCKDELETWTASETELFEEALKRFSKVFPDILTDYFPSKTSKSIVEFYYFWKTTDLYIRHRKNKMNAQGQKLEQVYIPDYCKTSSAVLYNRESEGALGCECCYVESSPQWYAWGLPNQICRICSVCWAYWKKYGGLKYPSKGGLFVCLLLSFHISPQCGDEGFSISSGVYRHGDFVPLISAIIHWSVGVHRELLSCEMFKSIINVLVVFKHPRTEKPFTLYSLLYCHPIDRPDGRNSSTTLAAAAASLAISPKTAVVDHQQAPSHHPLLRGGLTKTVFRCSQPDCVKEFRNHDNLLLHLTQVHHNATSAATGPAVVHLESGTQCTLTPAYFRIVRTLCPLLLRPAVLARRPTKLANSTAQERPLCDPLIPTDDLVGRLTLLAKTRIPGLVDPQSVLSRSFPTRRLNPVIQKLRLHGGVPDNDHQPDPVVSFKPPCISEPRLSSNGDTVTVIVSSSKCASPPMEKRSRTAVA